MHDVSVRVALIAIVHEVRFNFLQSRYIAESWRSLGRSARRNSRYRKERKQRQQHAASDYFCDPFFSAPSSLPSGQIYSRRIIKDDGRVYFLRMRRGQWCTRVRRVASRNKSYSRGNRGGGEERRGGRGGEHERRRGGGEGFNLSRAVLAVAMIN